MNKFNISNKNAVIPNKLKHLSPINFSETEYSALRNYTTYGSKSLNTALWKNKGKILPTNPLSAALLKAPPSPNSFNVYTGMAAQNADKLGTGHIHIPSYTSTSLDINVAKRFAQPDTNKISHIIKIEIRPNQKVGASVQQFSDRPEEQEFLLNNNHILKFNKPSILHTMPDGSSLMIHHAIILNPDEISKEQKTPEIDSYHNSR